MQAMMNNSYTTWLPHDRRSFWIALAVWFVVLTSCASFRERHTSELLKGGGFDWQVKFQACTWVLLGLFALYLIVSRRADLRLLFAGPLFWYCLFVIYAVVSACWSSSPLLTAYRGIQHGIALILVISLRRHLQHLNAFIIVFLGINWLLVILSLTGMHGGIEWIARPQDAVFLAQAGAEQWRFRSAFGSPSYISIIAGVGAISLSMRMGGDGWLARGGGVLFLTLSTILTVSRTAIAGLGAGLFVVAIARRRLLPWVCIAGVVFPLALMSANVRATLGGYLRRGQTSQELVSLTGRTPVYQQALQRAQESMIMGEGFQSARIKPLDDGWLHAHNLFLEALTGVGIVGAVCASMVVLSSGFWLATLLLRNYGQRGPAAMAGWENLAMAVPLLAFCILDRGFVSNVNAVVFTYMAVMAKTQTEVMDGATSIVTTPSQAAWPATSLAGQTTPI